MSFRGLPVWRNKWGPQYFPELELRYNDFFTATFRVKIIMLTSGEQVRAESGDQVRDQVKQLLAVMEGERSVVEIINLLALKGRRSFRESYLNPALSAGLIEMTQPDAPNSPTQKYRLTAAGRKLLATTRGNKHD